MPASPGFFRTLGIPIVLDRLIQQSIAQVLTPIFEGKWDEYRSAFSRIGETAQNFVSATPYFCPLHLSGGKSGGKNRPKLSNVVRGALATVPGLEASQSATVEELVFDYDAQSLAYDWYIFDACWV